MPLLIELAERAWLPDVVIRLGIRRLLSRRLRECETNPTKPIGGDIAPIAIETAAANEQHYEVVPAFFDHVLGPRLKYSCCWYDRPAATLEEAERAMLALTCERAEIQDGMDILELGCGWGSLTLWMAEMFPNSQVTAVSNSHQQRETIQAVARARGLTNVRVHTADINQFRPEQTFDRIVSVEMFEHVRNHITLMEHIASWLRPSGKLFVHLFCHDRFAYTYEDRGKSDWMTRHFFSGGMMPSYGYLGSLPVPFTREQAWRVNGIHYARTCRDWLERLDSQRDVVEALFRADMGPVAAAVQVQRWRMFFMACEELFAWHGGNEWYVGHYLFAPTPKTLTQGTPTLLETVS